MEQLNILDSCVVETEGSERGLPRAVHLVFPLHWKVVSTDGVAAAFLQEEGKLECVFLVLKM